MPAQMLVVTDNGSLSLGLTGLEYDVVDLRPKEFEWWLAGGSEPPALLVVGVELPSDALGIVVAAMDRHPETPNLVVSSTAAGWENISFPGERVEVLPLPVTRVSLVAAARRLIGGAVSPPSVAAVPQSEPASPPPPTAPAARAAPAAPVAPVAPVVTAPAIPKPAPARHMVAARSTDALRERLAHRAGLEEGLVGAASAPTLPFDPTALRGDRNEPPTVPGSDVPDHGRAPAPSVTADLRALVEGVLAAVDELHDVRDAATAVVAESLTAAHGECGVVLLPDDGVWRVAGAANVRPLEWRYVVEPDSWLVTTVISGDRGLVIEDTDIARTRLGGAPLAHHQQLLAAPIPQSRGLVLVARAAEPFTEQQLGAVADIAAQAGPLLADALRVRDLARALSDFRALVD